jgi:hypothetical protein
METCNMFYSFADLENVVGCLKAIDSYESHETPQFRSHDLDMKLNT